MDKYDEHAQPEIPEVQVENIPEELKSLNQWTCWKYVWDGRKWTKPPVSIQGFRHDHALSSYTFEEVLAAHKKDPSLGIGFSLRKSDPFCGLDFDDVLDKNSKLLPEFRDLLEGLPNTYSEISPSGRGIRVFGKGDIPNQGSKKGKNYETYSSNRFLTVTGNANGSAGQPLNDLTRYAQKLTKQTEKPVTAKKEPSFHGNTTVAMIISQMKFMPNSDYEDWLQIGMILHNESGGHELALEAWDEWSKGSEKYVPDGCAQKWASFGKSNRPEIGFGTFIEMFKPYSAKMLEYEAGNHTISAKELFDLNPGPRQFCIEPLFLESSFNMIHATRGLGKTNFALSLALSLAEGKNFLKWRVKKPRRVLYVDGELSKDAMSRQLRLNTFAIGERRPSDNLTIITPELLSDSVIPNLSKGHGQSWLNRRIDEVRPEVIIFDSLFTLFQGQTESQEAWDIVQIWMIKLRAQGKCLILIHHDNKSGKAQSGFGNKEISMDEVVHLTATKEHEKSKGMMMHVEFSKHRNLYGEEIEEFEAGFEKIPTEKNIRAVKWIWTKENVALDQSVKSLLESGLSTNEIAIELDISKSKAIRMRKKMLEDGTISDSELKRAKRNRR